MLKLKRPKLIEVIPDVFLVIFNKQFDVAMTFCRFQEYYESPKFRNKRFTWHEYIRWYSLTYGRGAFKYTKEYNGFNLPSHTLIKALKELHFVEPSVQDEYTSQMVDIVERIFKKRGESFINNKPFYLIGVHTEKDDESFSSLVKHEVAHGLYYTNPTYRKEMNTLINLLEFPEYDHLIWALRNAGYGANFHDEIQAYMSTGLRYNMSGDILNDYRPSFKKILKKYFKYGKKISKYAKVQ